MFSKVYYDLRGDKQNNWGKVMNILFENKCEINETNEIIYYSPTK